MSRGKMSYENAMSSGNSMSHLVEIPRIVSWKIYISTANIGILYAKYLMLPCESMHVEMELYVVERYHTYTNMQMSLVKFSKPYIV